MRPSLEVVKRNADRLLTLTSELLDLRRIESGMLKLTLEPLDLRDHYPLYRGNTAIYQREKTTSQSRNHREPSEDLRRLRSLHEPIEQRFEVHT